MKTLLLLLGAVLLLLGSSAPLAAQEPVTTGTIQGIVPKAGTLTVRSDQSSRPITFQGIDRANIFTSDGTAAQVSDLQVGMSITVQYAVRGDQWFVSKVILNAPGTPGGAAAGPTGAPGSAAEALTKPIITREGAPLRRRNQP